MKRRFQIWFGFQLVQLSDRMREWPSGLYALGVKIMFDERKQSRPRPCPECGILIEQYKGYCEDHTPPGEDSYMFAGDR